MRRTGDRKWSNPLPDLGGRTRSGAEQHWAYDPGLRAGGSTLFCRRTSAWAGATACVQAGAGQTPCSACRATGNHSDLTDYRWCFSKC